MINNIIHISFGLLGSVVALSSETHAYQFFGICAC